jgi:MFS transporter, DHA3 family, tetracycline resistance protein
MRQRSNALKIYLVLCAVESLATGMIFSYTSVYEVSVARLGPLQLVLVGTLLETTVFLFEIPTGIIADVYSRRLSVIIGEILIGAGFILEGAWPFFATILLAQVVWGIGAACTSGATDAWIADEVGEAGAGEAFVQGSQAGRIGSLVGIGIGMGLASRQLNLPIVVGGGLFILLAIALVLVMPEHGFVPKSIGARSHPQQMWATFQDGIQLVRRKPVLVKILSVGLFYGLYSEGFDRLWTKLILDQFVLPPLGIFGTMGWFGLLRALAILLAAGAMEGVRRRIDLTDNAASGRAYQRVLAASAVMLVLGLLGFAWAGAFILAAAAFLFIAIIRSISSPLYTAWVNQQLEPEVRATVLSMSSQIDAIGQIGGGPLIGLIGAQVSVRAAISASALLITPVVGLIGRQQRQIIP